VLEDKGASHFFVALETPFVFAEQHRPARSPHIASVHIMAGSTEHPSFWYGVVVLKHKLAFNVEVAGKTSCFSVRANNLALISHTLDVKTSGSVACFTAFGLSGVCIFRRYVDGYACVVGKIEIPGLCIMAGSASFRPDITRTRN
jgi:hypothetical protein